MAPMNVLLRDTLFGQIVHAVSKRKAFRHAEDDPDFVIPDSLQKSIGNHGKKVKESTKPKASTLDNAEKQEKREQPSASQNEDLEAQSRDSQDTAVERSEQEDKNSGDHITVGWYGDHDPENPLNWSGPRKAFVTFCIMLITTSVYAGSSIYTPGLMEAERDLGVGQVAATLGLSMFVFGYATGPMVLSPITEIPSVGRTAPYIITLAIYVALQVPAALINNFAGFIIVRFLQGFFGSPPLATGGASIVDMYNPVMRPVALGLWGLSAAAGPSLGPVMSSFAIQAKGWHWHAWIMLWLSGFSLVFLFFALPETSAINILVRRARRLRKLTGNDKLKSEGEIEQANMTGKDILMIALVRPLQFTFSEPIVMAINIYIGFIYALLYCWFESFPIGTSFGFLTLVSLTSCPVVFAQGYGFSLGISTLPYLSLLVGAIIGWMGFVVWNQTWYKREFFKDKEQPPPEKRLPPMMVGGFCYPITLFWFGWSANRTHWAAPVIGASFFGMGTSLMFQGALNYLPDAYPRYAASVLASNDFTRSYIAGAFPLFASALFRNLGIDWGNSLLGFISIAMIPIPFVLYKFGPKLRERTSFAN